LNGNDFEKKWRNGRFIECLNLNVSDITSNTTIKETFVHRMAQFRDFIQRYNSTPILFGGTLLGLSHFYYHCFGVHFIIVPHNSLLNFEQKKFEVDDSLELSVRVDSVKIDLFFIYNDNENDWVGGMIVPKKAKLKWTYPHIDDFCVGDLYGVLFNVPCNVEDVLEADYGVNWTIPHRSASFVWYKSHRNVKRNGYWKKSEWSTVYKQFSKKKSVK
uniref:Fukutin (inferred by orthology to a human protein) n=1 Tax=Anisakis simplex TaxID=6269 RepID=A0A0M3J7H7_ANISI